MPDELNGVTDGTEDDECANCGRPLTGNDTEVYQHGLWYCTWECADEDLHDYGQDVIAELEDDDA